MQNTKINYQSIFNIIFYSFIIYGIYLLFNIAFNKYKSSEEIVYLTEVNKNYLENKNIYKNNNSYFNSSIHKNDHTLSINYTNVNNSFCENLLESIKDNEQIWTLIEFKEQDKFSTIHMEDINDEAIDYMCSDTNNLTLTIDKNSEEFKNIESIREKQLNEKKQKDIDTKELEFILTNLYNFQDNKSAVDSSNNPHNRVFGFLVQNYSKKIEDRKRLIISYEEMPKSLCDRFINVTYNQSMDEFQYEHIKNFDRNKVNVFINEENVKNLKIHKVDQLCSQTTKIKIETE